MASPGACANDAGAQPADAESAPPRASPAASDGSAASRQKPAGPTAPAASATSGAPAVQALGLTNGAAQSAVTGVQQPAPAAPTVRPDGAPLPKPVLVTLPATAAGGAAAQEVVQSLPAPRGGPVRQPNAAAGRPVSAGALAEAKGRTAIAEQVEKGMRQHFPGMSDETLAQWHSNLEGTLAEAKAAHSIAKDNIKQADAARVSARMEYRDTNKKDAGKQKAWKEAVINYKAAQEQLKTTREGYYRFAAGSPPNGIAVARGRCPSAQLDSSLSTCMWSQRANGGTAYAGLEVVTREKRRRADGGSVLLAAPAPAVTADGKRKRPMAPQEDCPYCAHTYTVRDGLSAKINPNGERLHLRKCQCREKTPPCRNCPKCKDVSEIAAMLDPDQQLAACKTQLQCDICACRCPGTGKWVESDPTSRLNYAQRTVQRRAALEDLGWDGARSQASAPGTLLPPPRASAAGAAPAAKRERKGVSRLPADIRTELADKGQLAMPARAGSTTQALMTLALQAPLPSTPSAPPPELPQDVIELVEEVVSNAAGKVAAAAVMNYLQSQRVTDFSDLQYVELQWLLEALQPEGLTPLLLKKFLHLAGQRIAAQGA